MATQKRRLLTANTKTQIKPKFTALDWVNVVNLTGSVVYLHLYEAPAEDVTPGTTTPSFTFQIAANGTSHLPLGHSFERFDGLTVLTTTTIDGSTGDPGTGNVIVNLSFD